MPETEAPGEAPDARSPRARDVSPGPRVNLCAAAEGFRAADVSSDPANAETPSSEAPLKASLVPQRHSMAPTPV